MACKGLVRTSSAQSTRPRSLSSDPPGPRPHGPTDSTSPTHEAVSPDGGVLGCGLEARGEGFPHFAHTQRPEVRPPILMAPSRTEVEHVETRPVMPKVARLPCTGSATVSRGPPVTTVGARQHQDPKPEPCHPQNQPPCESPASTGYPQLNCLWCIC